MGLSHFRYSIAKRSLFSSQRVWKQQIAFSSTFLPPYVDPKLSYAYGRSTGALIHRPVGYFLEKRVNQRPEGLAIVSQHENLRIDNKTLWEDTNYLAYGIYHELGIRSGDVICIWSCNSYKWIQLQLAANLIGAVICTVNPAYKGPELAFAIQKSKAKAIFMPGKDSKQNEINNFYDIITKPSMLQDLKKNSNLQTIVTIDEHNGTGCEEFSVRSMQSLIGDANLNPELTESVDVDAPSLIMFTSGTTGKPKGAVLSQFTLINNAICSFVRMDPVAELTSMCLPLPLFHSYAFTLGSLSTITSQGSLVLPGYRYNSEEVIKAINNEKCDTLLSTPTMVIDLMNYARKNKLKIPSLRHLISGGASMPVETAHQINKVFTSVEDFRIGYGATETGPVSAFLDKTDPLEKRCETVGKPLDFVELQVVDTQSNKIVPLDHKGELLIRGYNLMIGYLDDEEKTKEAITPSGWYKTGDIAIMDSEGFVKICGRTKEMIIRGGENVYPLEVEQVLHEHPNILDAYVIGIPDERVGEEIYAWVKLRDINVKTTVEEIREFCKDKITYFKIPKHILFVDGFPLTPAGKAKKFEMVEETCKQLGIKKL